MSRTGEMNEDDVLQAVRGSVERAARPALEAIVARGRSRQRRRLAGASLAGAAAVAAVTVGVTGAMGADAPATPGGAPPAHLAAFSVTGNPDGTTTLVVSASGLLDSGAVSRALAAHGIPALVTDGSFCTSNPAPAGFTQVVQAVPHPHARVRNPPGALPRGHATHRAVLVINGSAMPAGTELQHRVLRRPGPADLGDAHRQGRPLMQHDPAHRAAARRPGLQLAVSLTARPGRPGHGGVRAGSA